MSKSTPVVFFDRDGVICEHVPFLHKLSDFKMKAHLASRIASLKKSGYLIFLVSNQPMLAMGLLTEPELQSIHSHMQNELQKAGGEFDGIYYCPHSPTDRGATHPVAALIKTCDCQKPKIGLFEKAKTEFEGKLKTEFDLKNSYMLGDSWRDWEFAKASGLQFLGVAGGDGFKESPPLVFADTYLAIDHIVSKSRV